MKKLLLNLNLLYIKHTIIFHLINFTTFWLIIQYTSHDTSFCEYIRNPETISEEMYNGSQYIPRDIDLVCLDNRGTKTTYHGDGSITVNTNMDEKYKVYKLNRHEQEYYSIYPPENTNEIVSSDGKTLTVYEKRFNNYQTYNMDYPAPGVMTDVETTSGEVTYAEYLSSFSPKQQAEMVRQELFYTVKQNLNANLSLRENVYNILNTHETTNFWLSHAESELRNPNSLANNLLFDMINFVNNCPHLSRNDVEIYCHISSMITIMSSATVLHLDPMALLNTTYYETIYDSYRASFTNIS